MSDKDPRQTFLAVSENDTMTFAFPDDANRFMTEAEAFLAACFTVWIMAEADKDAAVRLRNLIIRYAKATVGEIEQDTVN